MQLSTKMAKSKILKQYINEDGILVTVYRTYPPRPEEKPRNNRYTIFNQGRMKSQYKNNAFVTTEHRYGNP